jgi:hypothetical protein
MVKRNGDNRRSVCACLNIYVYIYTCLSVYICIFHVCMYLCFSLYILYKCPSCLVSERGLEPLRQIADNA